MKFLHTADWHLGVKTNGRDRLGEQKKVLDEIVSLANYENIDCVIIAGDVFNTANPSADAEELFFDTIEKLSNGGDRFVFVLAGNHDDPTRLSAGLPLASKHNIALVGDLKKLNVKSFNKNSVVRVIETGRGHIKIQKNEEIVCIAYLPYPTDSRIDEKIEVDYDGEGEPTYSFKVSNWAEMGASAFNDNEFNIFVSHLFLVGAKTGDSVVKVGDILAVSASDLPKANYTALGHLHRRQEVAENMFYSGAISKLSVGEGDLSIMVFESENGKLVSASPVKLSSPARYERVVANSIQEAEEKLEEFDDNDIVELQIVSNSLLPASELKALKKNFACISNIVLVKPENQNGEYSAKGRTLLGDRELFTEFYKSVRCFEPSEETVKMFLDCKGESDETN